MRIGRTVLFILLIGIFAAGFAACEGQTGDDGGDDGAEYASNPGPEVPPSEDVDADDDGVLDDVDNCPLVANPDQVDSDSDGVGDTCDAVDDRNTGSSGGNSGGGNGEGGTVDDDADDDGIKDDVDNCPSIANPDQADSDSDGLGDVCDEGKYLGDFEWTYYYISFEEDFAGPKNGKIYFEDGSFVAARQEFVDKVKIEGTGYLDDGHNTMINQGEDCAFDPDGVCFFIVDTDLFPYGVGSEDNPLHPWRTVAAEENFHPDVNFGERFYVAELDGIELPAIDASVFEPADAGFTWDDGCGCYRHDGCVVVEDEGVTGLHFDFFALTRPVHLEFEAQIESGADVHVYAHSPLCE